MSAAALGQKLTWTSESCGDRFGPEADVDAESSHRQLLAHEPTCTLAMRIAYPRLFDPISGRSLTRMEGPSPKVQAGLS